ncbi:tetratricopeptide repeat-containing sulfotransferase family protein [Aurantiacibacter poecillastricola]|uniref:tetratricopeptide repeat-containing sulfotransferase family protein n=1 Tax=Aurantiacibacter poecillastricola TaxID=3064385 RepID=UPI0035A33DD0
MLAHIALEHDNWPGATKLADLIRRSGHSEAWLDLIDARLALARQEAAAARQAIARAAQAGTDNPHLAAQIAVVLARTGLHEEAAKFSAQAVEGTPDEPGYRYNHAIELQFVGDLAGARTQFEAVLKLAPGHAQSWLALLGLEDNPPTEWRDTLEALFGEASDVQARLIFGHALAKWHEAHGQWDESFDWLERAKEGKAREVGHDREQTDRLFAAAAAGAERFTDPSWQESEQGPIFIVGLPRSGTTLIERIVAAHPLVHSAGELPEFGIALKRHLQTPGQHVLDVPLLEAAAGAEDLAPVGRDYLRRIAGVTGDKPFFTDKMPFNVFYAPAILKALPQARIVCLRRFPLDVVFANFRQLFATGFSYYSYAYGLGDTAHFVARFETLCDRLERELPPDRFMVQRYEDMVTDQEHQTRRLIEFCGLEWDAACLSPQSNRQAVATASAVQVRSPVHAGSVGRWKRYGPAAERVLADFESLGLDLREG